MKRCFLNLLLASGIVVSICSIAWLNTATAQTQESELFYTYYDQKIPLQVRADAIAVQFKPQETTRGNSSTPPYLQLQQDLQSTRATRAATAQYIVSPLSNSYALVKLLFQTRGSSTSALQKQIEQQSYVETTVPVVKRSDRNELIVLPNEIIVSFDALSDSQIQNILKTNKLEIIRALRFSSNRYLVKPTSATGTEVLDVANQLNKVKGVKSATPNFIQSPSEQKPQAIKKFSVPKIPGITDQLTKSQDTRSKTASFQSNLLPLQWYLYNTPLSVCFKNPLPEVEALAKCLQNPSKSKSAPSRTDLRAKEAWQQSNAGQGVLVAVVDSLIQWDHPDLAKSVYTAAKANKLPGEVSGWDFVDNDPDTRISQDELAIYRPLFQDTFVLSEAKLLQKYPEIVQVVKQANPSYSKAEIASVVRDYIQSQITALFHGTMVSGVIAAQPQNGQGLVGVAPNAKILPVTVAKQSFEPAAIVEGIGYAAARGADVINMSFGGSIYAPVEDVADVILEVQNKNPKIVFVAAAGNENLNEVSFPATMRGVISVGATDLTGNRAPYSNFGTSVDFVAPGGDLSNPQIGPIGGILTTGGTWVDGFWQGISVPNYFWGGVLDPQGRYIWTNGTSFASPAVAGVVALMKGEDPKRQLTRDRLVAILKKTASDKELNVSKEDLEFYGSITKKTRLPDSITPKKYFFSSGLVNAAAAVNEVKQTR